MNGEKQLVWSTYNALEKFDDRWSITPYIKPVNSSMGYYQDIYGLTKSRSWYNLIDTTTGYVVNVLVKPEIKKFIKFFNTFGFTAEIVDNVYTNALYDSKAVTQYYITVCEYTSSCKKYKIRAWAKYNTVAENL